MPELIDAEIVYRINYFYKCHREECRLCVCRIFLNLRMISYAHDSCGDYLVTCAKYAFPVDVERLRNLTMFSVMGVVELFDLMTIRMCVIC